MKKTVPYLLKLVSAGLCLAASLLAIDAKAVNSFFDVNGTTAGSGIVNGGTFSWELTAWSTTNTGTAAVAAWTDGNFPEFSTAADTTGFSYTVNAGSPHQIAGALTRSTTGTVTLTGADLTIAGGVQQGFFSSGFLTISNKLTGTGGVISQSGQLFLNGPNDYSGGTTPGPGLLNFNSTSSFGTGNLILSASGGAIICEGTSAILITNNWTLSLATVTLNCVGNPAGITYSGNIALGADTFNIGSGGAVGNIDIFSGVISGTGNIGRSLAQANAGIVKFTGANTYTGKTSLQSGTTFASVINSVTTPAQQTSSSFGVPSSAANGTISIGGTTGAGTLVYNGPGETTDRIVDLGGTTGGATIEADGTGALIFTGVNTASGVGAKTLTLQGTSTAANSIGKLVNSSSGATTFVKAQAGNWTLTGVNTFTGNMTVSGGTLTIGGAGQLNSGSYAGTIADTASLVYASSAAQTLSGVISGTAGKLTQNGSGNLILTAAETYTGATTINGGSLILSGAGALPASSSVTIMHDASLDASTATATTYTLGTGATLTAIGASGGHPAFIFGNTAVSFGARPIILSYLPTTFNGDLGADPALNVFQGTLALNGNSFTVTNAAATPLGAGTYTLVFCIAGISGSPSPFVTVKGAGLAAGMGASIQTNAGGTELDLVVQTAPVFSGLTASQSITYGTPTVTFSGTLSGAGPTFPAMGDTVTVTIGGIAQTTTISDGLGSFSIVYNSSTLNVAADAINYSYAGNNTVGLSPATDATTTLTITKAPLTITANNQSKTYGQVVAFTTGNTNFTSSGLQNGQTIGTVTLAVSGSGGAAAATVAGSPYTITPSAPTGGTFLLANYSASFVTGTLTVNPALLTVTGTNASRSFGSPNPAFGANFTGFSNSQTLVTSDVGGAPSFITAATTASDVGTYDITNGIGTLTSTNYSFVFVDGTLTVTNVVSTNVVTASANPSPTGSNVTFNATLTTAAPSTAVPTNSVQFVIDGVPFGSPVFPVAGVASVSTASLTHGTHTVEADYTGDTNALGATNILGSTNLLTGVLINTAPVAGAASYGRQADVVPFQIPISSLLTNASDADSDPISLVSVSAFSTNAGTVTTNTTMVTYTPPGVNPNVTDTFTYTVSDTFTTTTGTVTVTILPNSVPVTITSVVTQPNGTQTVSFSGVPNFEYFVQATTNLDVPVSWTTISTNTAGPTGLFQLNDADSTNFPARFYRSVTP